MSVYSNKFLRHRLPEGHAEVPGSWVEGAMSSEVPCEGDKYHVANMFGAGCTYKDKDLRRLACQFSGVKGKPIIPECGDHGPLFEERVARSRLEHATQRAKRTTNRLAGISGFTQELATDRSRERRNFYDGLESEYNLRSNISPKYNLRSNISPRYNLRSYDGLNQSYQHPNISTSENRRNILSELGRPFYGSPRYNLRSYDGLGSEYNLRSNISPRYNLRSNISSKYNLRSYDGINQSYQHSNISTSENRRNILSELGSPFYGRPKYL